MVVQIASCSETQQSGDADCWQMPPTMKLLLGAQLQIAIWSSWHQPHLSIWQSLWTIVQKAQVMSLALPGIHIARRLFETSFIQSFLSPSYCWSCPTGKTENRLLSYIYNGTLSICNTHTLQSNSPEVLSQISGYLIPSFRLCIEHDLFNQPLINTPYGNSETMALQTIMI